MRAEEWVVVLELAGEGGELAEATVEQLVANLSSYEASALYCRDRYALQLVVEASSSLFALQRGLAVHAEAAVTLEMPMWAVVRVEVMTVPELERGWDEDVSASPIGGDDRWEPGGPHGSAVQRCERALIHCKDAQELQGALVEFVRGCGGEVRPAGEPDPSMVLVDLSLGVGGEPLFALAEPFSMTRLVMEETLLPLVDDARRIAVLLHAAGRSARWGEAAASGRELEF